MRCAIPDEAIPTVTAFVARRAYPIPLAYALMLHAGLRVGETVALAWDDLVKLDQPVGILRLQAHATKGNSEREIPVGPTLADVIRSTWLNRAQRAGFAPAHYALAQKPNGDPITVRTIQRGVRAAGHAAKLPFILTPHILRHTFATRVLRQTNLAVVQALLGHKRISTTAIYTHPNVNDLTAAINRVAAADRLPADVVPRPLLT